jgi:hypothetical protein|tara:strand:+ start:46 stop:450 length:405 start_codon:yes stop_codon:yes gene_type:complete
MSSEKNFFKQIKASLNKTNFIQKIENKFNSGFPDLIIIIDTLPLFIELKAPIKGNKIKFEKSQVSIHLRIFKSKYISFVLVKDPSTSNAFLFDGYSVANAIVLGQEQPCFMFHGTIIDCLQFANQETTKRGLRV